MNIETQPYLYISDEGDYVPCVLLTKAGFHTLIDRIVKLENNTSDSSTNPKLEDELAFIRSEELDPQAIAQRYNKNNTNRNGFSTTEIYQYLGGTGNPIEIDMAKYIYSKINQL